MSEFTKDDMKELMREVVLGIRDAQTPTSDEQIRVMLSRPLKEEQRIACETPDGCKFTVVVAPHSERGNIVKDIAWESFPENPWPKDYRPKNHETGELTMAAKHLLFETFTKKWTCELIGKPLPWFLHPDAREAVRRIEDDKKAAIAQADASSAAEAAKRSKKPVEMSAQVK